MQARGSNDARKRLLSKAVSAVVTSVFKTTSKTSAAQWYRSG